MLFAASWSATTRRRSRRPQRQQRLGKSLIDFVRADISRLRGRLAAAEQLKLDQHLDGAARPREAARGAIGRPRAIAPCRRGRTRSRSFGASEGAAPYFDAITDAHIDILAQAIACDITRFATLFLADLSFDGNPLGLPEDNHGDVAHRYRGSGLDTGLLMEGEADTWLPLARLNAYSFGKTARLMQRLSELGALDSTLIYASGSMGDPAQHSPMNAPTLLAGGATASSRWVGASA